MDRACFKTKRDPALQVGSAHMGIHLPLDGERADCDIALAGGPTTATAPGWTSFGGELKWDAMAMRLDSTLIAAALSAAATIAAAWIATRSRGRGAPTENRGPEIWLPGPRPEPPPPTGPLQRAGQRIRSVAGAIDASLWRLLERLPPLKRRKKPWLAAVLGFLFGGFGVALYLRRSVDVVIGIVLLIPLSLGGSQFDTGEQAADQSLPAWIWFFQALSGLYCFLRATDSNRRLGAGETPAGRSL